MSGEVPSWQGESKRQPFIASSVRPLGNNATSPMKRSHLDNSNNSRLQPPIHRKATKTFHESTEMDDMRNSQLARFTKRVFNPFRSTCFSYEDTKSVSDLFRHRKQTNTVPFLLTSDLGRFWVFLDTWKRFAEPSLYWQNHCIKTEAHALTVWKTSFKTSILKYRSAFYGNQKIKRIMRKSYYPEVKKRTEKQNMHTRQQLNFIELH